MSTSATRMWSALLLALLAITITGSGCGSSESQKRKDEIVWPLPPEPTRIRFVRSFSSSEDVEGEKGVLSFLADLLAGSDTTTSMSKPYDVHADATGRIFVSDTGRGRLMVFDPERKEFETWGEDGAGMLKRPIGIASDDAGNIYVSDATQARVVRFDPKGEYVRAYGGGGEIERPAGVVINNELGRLYVVDVGNHQLAVYDLEKGDRIKTIGTRGDRDLEFNYPTNIAIAADGRLFVMDTMNFRVQVLDAEGEFISKFGRNCDAMGCLARSKGIALDSDGHVYVADAAFNVVQVFNQEGQLLLPFGGAGHGPGRLWLAAGVSIDAKDRIYVADQYNFRVNVYQYVSQPEPEATPSEEEGEPADEAGSSPPPSETAPPPSDSDQPTEPPAASP